VILPILQSEIADKKGWVTQEEIIEYFALSQSLPGVIAANISIFVGHKILGIRGAIAAISGVIAPAFLAIVLIANIMAELVDKSIVRSIFAGVGVGVVILVILTIKEVWSKSVPDNFSKVIFMAALILTCIKVSPVWIITGGIVCGILYKLFIKEDVEQA
jgi:chromate transporter